MFEQELEPQTYEPPHTEITLSNGTLLLMFFGLVLVCGLFFGFGYSLGRRASAPLLAPGSDSADTGGAATSATDSEPPASAPGKPSAAKPRPQPVETTAGDAGEPPAPVHARVAPPPPASPVAKPKPAPAAPPSTASTLPAAAAPLPGGRSFYVQAAAVAHQADAEALANALRKKGYAVEAKQGSADQLYHVQMGPFATQKDAAAQRDRLVNDGYMAIVK